MPEWLNPTSLIATLGLFLGVVNSVFIYLRLGHDVRMRKTELALKLAELEYERLSKFEAPRGTDVYGPQHLLDIFLPLIDEIYRTGSFDAAAFAKRTRGRAEEFRKIDLAKKP